MNKPIPFGKYFLLERINVGGMAEVFRAKHFGVEGFERLVAVKRILPNIAEDKEFISMFIDEAKIAVMLNHANIAQVFDLGNENGAYYIALEHIHGRDLRAIFDRNRDQGNPMPVPQACFVTMKVCEGLDYAHNKRDETGQDFKLVHRDVSPQNVLVSFDGEVKIIDFGIAKAAGKGSQTQAGILKGKFGYMSPEQVRGLPIDRRSDVFACGIVLYELLTGERLFVGESDFSTLEKVRNVEILPPSTYNRKIQPELERIVLKALSKDVEDRYQNAIDLHDELQAFVYTSGEFYSRKDLASWMKNMWSKEIKEESAKLASYRDMKPPPAKNESSPQRSRTPTISAKGNKDRKTAPPPIPGKGPSTQPPSKPPVKSKRSSGDKDSLEWDDDELETSIYDEELPAAVAALSDPTTPANDTGSSEDVPLAAASQSSSSLHAPALTGSALGGDTLIEPKEEPDLSSLVSTVHGWDAPQSLRDAQQAKAEKPNRVADGSNKTKSPFEEKEDDKEAAAISLAGLAASSAALESQRAEPFFGGPTLSAQPKQNNNAPYYLVGLALLIAGVVVVILLLNRQEKTQTAQKPAVHQEGGIVQTPGQGMEPAVQVTSIVDENTGFDLIVDPVGAKVKLDGEDVGVAPLRIRQAVGEHTVEIEGPPGFKNKTKKINVAAGSAERISVTLDIENIVGKFTTEPAGAEVVLVIDGVSKAIGTTPVDYTLDPRKSYEVMFSLNGFVNLAQPVEVNGDAVVQVAGKLEPGQKVAISKLDPKPRVRDTTGPGNTKPNKPNVVKPIVPKTPVGTKPKPQPVTPTPVKTKPPVVEGSGTLLLSAKPPCRIFVDGRDTGLKTPQRNIKLSSGRHRITLMNNEFGIKESFSVQIKPNKATKAVKDYTGQIK